MYSLALTTRYSRTPVRFGSFPFRPNSNDPTSGRARETLYAVTKPIEGELGVVDLGPRLWKLIEVGHAQVAALAKDIERQSKAERIWRRDGVSFNLTLKPNSDETLCRAMDALLKPLQDFGWIKRWDVKKSEMSFTRPWYCKLTPSHLARKAAGGDILDGYYVALKTDTPDGEGSGLGRSYLKFRTQLDCNGAQTVTSRFQFELPPSVGVKGSDGIRPGLRLQLERLLPVGKSNRVLRSCLKADKLWPGKHPEQFETQPLRLT